MQSDMMMQAIRVAELDIQRRNDSPRNQQLRLAKMSRPSLRNRLGQMLVSLGERMTGEPMPVTTPTPRTA